MTEELFVSIENYRRENWESFFKNNKTLGNCTYDLSWVIIFSKLESDEKYKKIENAIKNSVNNGNIVYPYPCDVFKAFRLTTADNVKAVFLGQDPYFNCENYEGINIPQAMGLSFSVPESMKIPSSLENIFKNMIKFGHLEEIPKSGNLCNWSLEGCLMLNCALTVEHGKKKSHLKQWCWFTDEIIRYISEYMENVIFVIWGRDALSKLNMIDLSKHGVSISSHPSGLSFKKKMGQYSSFAETDHFGNVNNFLKKRNIPEIMWNLKIHK
jgi:uracil-DNA glycosylase